MSVSPPVLGSARVTRARAVVLLVAAILAAGLVAGCGGDDDTDADTANESATVSIEDFSFAPADLTVSQGDTVTVTNDDDVTHTLTADDGSFDTGELAKGSTTITVDEPGSYTYHCEIHTYMKGTIEVTG